MASYEQRGIDFPIGKRSYKTMSRQEFKFSSASNKRLLEDIEAFISENPSFGRLKIALLKGSTDDYTIPDRDMISVGDSLNKNPFLNAVAKKLKDKLSNESQGFKALDESEQEKFVKNEVYKFLFLHEVGHAQSMGLAKNADPQWKLEDTLAERLYGESYADAYAGAHYQLFFPSKANFSGQNNFSSILTYALSSSWSEARTEEYIATIKYLNTSPHISTIDTVDEFAHATQDSAIVGYKAFLASPESETSRMASVKSIAYKTSYDMTKNKIPFDLNSTTLINNPDAGLTKVAAQGDTCEIKGLNLEKLRSRQMMYSCANNNKGYTR